MNRSVPSITRLRTGASAVDDATLVVLAPVVLAPVVWVPVVWVTVVPVTVPATATAGLSATADSMGVTGRALAPEPDIPVR